MSFFALLFLAVATCSAEPVLKVVSWPDSLALHSSPEPTSLADFLSLAIGLSPPKVSPVTRVTCSRLVLQDSQPNGVSAINDVLLLPRASLTVKVNAKHVVNASVVLKLIQVRRA